MKIEPGTMIKYFPEEVEVGSFGIKHITLTEEDVKRKQLWAAFNLYQYREVRGLKPGTYVKLVGKGHGLMMSDTHMEIDTNWEFIKRAHGDVLIAGLGLGIIVLSVQDKPEVGHITVVEKYPEVAELILDRVPINMDKFSLIIADIFDISFPKERKFDVIYFDIWDDVCADNNKEMVKLHRKFWRYLDRGNPHRWMSSWRKDDVRRLAYA